MFTKENRSNIPNNRVHCHIMRSGMDTSETQRASEQTLLTVLVRRFCVAASCLSRWLLFLQSQQAQAVLLSIFRYHSDSIGLESLTMIHT